MSDMDGFASPDNPDGSVPISGNAHPPSAEGISTSRSPGAITRMDMLNRPSPGSERDCLDSERSKDVRSRGEMPDPEQDPTLTLSGHDIGRSCSPVPCSNPVVHRSPTGTRAALSLSLEEQDAAVLPFTDVMSTANYPPGTKPAPTANLAVRNSAQDQSSVVRTGRMLSPRINQPAPHPLPSVTVSPAWKSPASVRGLFEEVPSFRTGRATLSQQSNVDAHPPAAQDASSSARHWTRRTLSEQATTAGPDGLQIQTASIVPLEADGASTNSQSIMVRE